MSNTNVTIDMVTREALRVAHEQAKFIGTVDRSYDDSFAKGGAKIGDTLRIRLPNEYEVRTSGHVMNVQDQAESSINLTVANLYGVDMRFNSSELALDIDDFSKRYIEPAVKKLVSKVDGQCLSLATKATFNTVGSAGAVPGASGDISALGHARARLSQNLAPEDERFVQIDSMTLASVVNGTKDLFHPGATMDKAFKEGRIARNAMAEWYENNRTYVLANPADVAGEIDESTETNFTQGTTTVHMDGLTTASNIVPGMVFTWEGLYAVHPETKEVYAHQQDFVVVSVANATSGDADITFSPAIYTTGAKQNVKTQTGGEVTWTSTGQDGKDITFRGSASTSYRYAMMYHKEAFSFVTADLPIMDDAHKCVRRTQDGLSMRVWQGSDIRNNELLMRIDMLWGFKDTRPAWASRIICN